MSAFDLDSAFSRMDQRLAGAPRQPRADRGGTRLPPPVERELTRLLNGQERPSMVDVLSALAAFSEERHLKPPSRATLYNAMVRVTLPRFDFAGLPLAVQQSLYNFTHDRHGSTAAGRVAEPGVPRVPGDQLVLYAFNYGAPRALSFASGAPWLCLWRAARKGGWRPKSRALLCAVMDYRGI